MMNDLDERLTRFVLSLFDRSTGGFRFSRRSPVTTIATCYAVFALEVAGALDSDEVSRIKPHIAEFLFGRYDESAGFIDPLLTQNSIEGGIHDFAYFSEELDCFCQQALDALGYEAPCFVDKKGFCSAETMIELFHSYHWSNPWLDSNRVMFALSQLCYSTERRGRLLAAELSSVLDWLDSQQCSSTGLWLNQAGDLPLSNCLAAWYHFGFFYTYCKRPMRLPNLIVQSALSLQHSDGLFFLEGGGHTCLDLDAIDLLVRCSEMTGDRASEVSLALLKARESIILLAKPNGGFCNSLVGKTPRGARAILRKLKPSNWSKPLDGIFQLCWSGCRCGEGESNVFSSWFRSLSLKYVDAYLGVSRKHSGTFRSLPFLGFRPSEE